MHSDAISVRPGEELNLASLADCGVSFPLVSVDPGWDEFDLGRVYREIAPRLVAEDSEFRREYEEMREQVHLSGARISGAAHADRIHRKWLPCDPKVVRHGSPVAIRIAAKLGTSFSSALRPPG